MSKGLRDFPRCNFVDSSGKRCRKHSGILHTVHLTEDLYDSPYCVEVTLCIEHADTLHYDYLKGKSK